MGEESGRRKIRGQIALEFMIVYTVVLVVFVIMFALIVNERSVTLGSQDSSLMQLIAENVAGGINQALQAGSGFAISVPLSTGIGFIPYKLYISSTGLVMAQTTVGKEVVSGIAASSARSLVVNGSVVNSSSGVYLYSLPTYVGFATLSNIKGTIYVDQHLPSLSALAGPILFNEPSRLKLPYFTGANSMITAFKSANLAISKNFTVDTWVYMEPGQGFTPVAGESSTTAQPFELVINNDLPIIEIDGSAAASSTYAISPGGWYNIAGTYNGTAASVYIDGALAGNSLTSNVPTGSANFTIGGAGHYPGNYLNGYEADVQLYNAPLTANQISQLYTAGPASNPKSDLGHLVGWWPLNGNSNDYSGYSTPTMQQNVIYTSALGVNIESLSLGGKPIGKLPLAISSTNNILGGSNSLAISTDADGYIGTLLSSNTFSGNARLNVLPYQGNISASANLEGWWPLDMGNGTAAPDFSGNGNSGNFIDGSYFKPNSTTNFLVSQFNGQTSYINGTGIYAFPISNFEWIYPVNYGTSNFQVISEWIGQIYQLALSTSGNIIIWNGANNYYGPVVPLDKWSLVGFYLNDTVAILYVNGKQQSFSITGTTSLPTSATSWIVGWQNCCGNRHFNGSMANIEVYNGLLSNNAYQQLYNEGITGTPLPNYNLTGWWPLSGTASNFANVKSAYGSTPSNIVYNSIDYNGVIQTNQTTLPLFNGNTAYVNAPIGTWIGTNHNLTADAWFYSTGGGGPIIGIADSLPGGGWNMPFLSMNSSGDVFGWIWGLSAIAYKGKFNRWYFGAVTYQYNSTTGGVEKFYVNGVLIGSLSGTYSPSGAFDYFTTYISGAKQANTPDYFNGSIIGVQIYNKTLTPVQIEQLYLQGLPTPESMNVSLG